MCGILIEFRAASDQLRRDEVISCKGRVWEAWESANIISYSAQLPVPFIFGPLRISVSIVLSLARYPPRPSPNLSPHALAHGRR